MSEFPKEPFKAELSGKIPDLEECFQLWDKYAMLEHIKVHSEKVAQIAEGLANLALSRNWNINFQAVKASALLHDLGKTYAVKYGGNHSQIGAAMAMAELKNPGIAQGIMHHVHWPGRLDVREHFLPLAIIYADKRVKHNHIVTLEQRFEDLYERYGINKDRIERIKRSFDQVKEIEQRFSEKLEVDLRAYPFDRGRMVQ